MKKIGLIGVGFVLAAAMFGVAGFAFAQTLPPDSLQPQILSDSQTTDSPEFPYGRAGWSRGTNGSMMGFGMDEGQPGLLHDYLWPAVAETFGLTDAQIEAFEIVRESIQEIQNDLTQEEIRDTMKEAIAIAIENALSDGAITEEQAVWWLERMEQMEGVAPGMPFMRGDKAGNFRQGFSRGVKFGRQMTVKHEYLDDVIADALDISIDELQELRSEEGFSLRVYATDVLGISDEEITDWQADVFTNAVNAALEDGSITQVQADWVLEHLENFEGWGGRIDQP